MPKKHAEDENDEEDHRRDNEQDLGNRLGARSNAGEAEETCDERNDEEDDGPLQHECSLVVNVAPPGKSFVAVFPLTLKWWLAAFLSSAAQPSGINERRLQPKPDEPEPNREKTSSVVRKIVGRSTDLLPCKCSRASREKCRNPLGLEAFCLWRLGHWLYFGTLQFFSQIAKTQLVSD